MSCESSSPPSVSGSIRLCTLPAGPEQSFRLYELAPMRCRRFTNSPGTSLSYRSFFAGAVSFLGPCRGSRPAAFRCSPCPWRRELPQLDQVLPSAALSLMTKFNHAVQDLVLCITGENKGKSLTEKSLNQSSSLVLGFVPII